MSNQAQAVSSDAPFSLFGVLHSGPVGLLRFISGDVTFDIAPGDIAELEVLGPGPMRAEWSGSRVRLALRPGCRVTAVGIHTGAPAAARRQPTSGGARSRRVAFLEELEAFERGRP